MTIETLYQDLLSAVSLTGQRAVLRVTATYQPAGGRWEQGVPAHLPEVGGAAGPDPERSREKRRADDSPYVLETRVVDGERRDDVLLDSTPSQANRAEEALLRARRAGVGAVAAVCRWSTRVRRRWCSRRWSSRTATPTPTCATAARRCRLRQDRAGAGRCWPRPLADATALYAHDPGSLVYGAWNSHRKGRQQKFPRVYASEVVGWDPVVGARNAGRMDPLNLQGAQKPAKDGEGWDHAPVATKTKGEKLSEIGHGNVAPNPQHGGVTISSAQRFATLSLAGLDRIGFGTAVVRGRGGGAGRAGRVRAARRPAGVRSVQPVAAQRV